MDTPTPAQIPQAPAAQVPFYQPGVPSNEPTKVEIKVDTPQVIEKIVYKKQKIHGFFRTLTIIALLVVGVLMLLENTGVMKLSIGNVALDLIYPIIVIFSTIIIRSYRGRFGKIFGLILFLGVVGGFFGINTYNSLNPSTKSQFGNFVSYADPAGDATGMVLTKLNINTLIGNFDIKGTDTKNLAEGTYKSDRNLLITTGMMTNYDYLYLKEDPNRNILQNYSSDLTLGISRTKVVDLYLKNLLGVHTIDLTDIRWANATIQGGIQDLDVTLGTNVFIDSTLAIQLVGGRITIHAPRNLGVKLYFKQRAGSLELTDFDIKGNNYYESKNLATAKKVVNINISTGISQFTLLWE